MELDSVLAQLESEREQDVEKTLQQYNTENDQTFKFDQKEEDKRLRLCQGLLNVLERNVSSECQRTCLVTLRILSRDKRVLSPVATPVGMLLLTGLAGLGETEEEQGQQDEEVMVEALKCLCNVVFNSVAAQQVAADMEVSRGLCARLTAGQFLRHEVVLFTLRLLFLLSALRPDVRDSLRRELAALPLLTDVLERILDVRWVGPYEVSAPNPLDPSISQDKSEQVMEALKALFNLTLSNTSEEDGDHKLRRLSAIVRHVLMVKTETEDKTEEAHSHAINLMSNIPASCLDVLIDVPVQGGTEEHEGKNMDAIQVLLLFMEKRIDRGTNYKEGLTPVLSLLTETSRYHREVRKYIKAKVLPPLKDVKNRPEIGTTVRNKLVRLMTHVDMGVKQTAAEFLFVLCKESVDNLLKYTGYGNAAGLLAARGLLAGGRGDGQYSDDEDSDTEEYKSAKPFINPITGHVEEPMTNPMEGMTEEQKEYEAEKLANMFDKLSREQLIRPMSVRRDGTLAPLEEALHQCNKENGGSSDSD